MKPLRIIPLCLLIAMASAAAAPRKVSTRHKETHRSAMANKQTADRGKESAVSKEIVTVTAESDTLAGAAMRDIRFSGFDKSVNSRREGFFITNAAALTLKEAVITIGYSTPDGRRLHSRTETVVCDIPPGETRHVSIRSWDDQGSFYFIHSKAPRSGGATPFEVTLRAERFSFEAGACNQPGQPD